MIFIHILSYSKSLIKLFDFEQVCAVHSVFDNTINLHWNDRIVSLIHQESTNTPMSIQLNISKEQFTKLKVKQHDLVHVSKDGVLIANGLFDRNQAKEFDLSYPVFNKGLDHNSLIQLKETIEIMLVSSQSQGSLNNALLCLLSLRQECENALEQQLFNKLTLLFSLSDESELISIVDSLIGFGEGLTPSGDDLIGGMLSIFHYLKSNASIDKLNNQVGQHVIKNASITTKISREYLLYACEGQFNEYVSDLYKKHLGNEMYGEYLQKISNLGHSSGTDFIVGMYIGLKIGGIQ